MQQSEIVVAPLIGIFAESDWCRMEFDVARERDDLVILPYLLIDQVPKFLGHIQARFLLDRDVTDIVKDVDERLRDPVKAVPGYNAAAG